MRPILSTLLVALAAYVIYVLVFTMNVGRVVFYHAPNGCFNVKGLQDLGSEDIQALPDGTALISSGVLFGQKVYKYREGSPHGGIFLFDFSAPEKPAVRVKIVGGLDEDTLNPHGLSIWQDPKSKSITVMLINHVGENSTVEIFHYTSKPPTLNYKKTVYRENFSMLNDIHATGEDSFYSTSYLYYTNHIMQGLETYLFLNWGQVVYFDGKKSSVVLQYQAMPNGITASKNNKYLYVAEVGRQRIMVYHLNADGSLGKEAQNYPVNTAADNLDVDEEGNLWTGAHPIVWQTMKHLKDPAYKSPSQVLRISTKNGLLGSMEEIYSSPGQELAASTVAVKYGDGLLIGTVCDKTVYCPLKY